jgi:hypothetical protein
MNANAGTDQRLPGHTPRVTRRAVLAASIVSCASFPEVAGATALDPIFAVIAVHRASVAAYDAAVSQVARLEDTLLVPDQTWHWRVGDDSPPDDCGASTEWIAAQIALRDASFREDEALVAVLTTTPNTLSGVAALLEYLGADADHTIVLADALEAADDALFKAAQAVLRRIAARLRHLNHALPEARS